MVYVTSLAQDLLLEWLVELEFTSIWQTFHLAKLIFRELLQVWEGEGVIKYGRKLIGATDPQKSEPGTIRGDLAVVVGR